MDECKPLVTGWNSGKLEVRNEASGEVVYRDNFTGPVSALLAADYRKDGGEDMICCSLDGEVRGQGLTLVRFSAQFEPCLTHKNDQHTLHTPKCPLNTGYTTPKRTPYPMKSAQVELRSERV